MTENTLTVRKIASTLIPITLLIGAAIGVGVYLRNKTLEERYEYEWGDYAPRHFGVVSFVRDPKTDKQVDWYRFGWFLTHARSNEETRCEALAFQVRSTLSGELQVRLFRSKPSNPIESKADRVFDLGTVRGSEKKPYVSKKIELDDFIGSNGRLRYPYISVVTKSALPGNSETETGVEFKAAWGEVETLPDGMKYNLRPYGVPISEPIEIDWKTTNRGLLEGRAYFPSPRKKK